jgi:predicted  nucleic acid-binding Zn-ribbon protein
MLVSSSSLDVTPLQKVVEMLDSVLAKGKKEKHEEEVEFAKFHEWCDTVRADKTKSIANLKDEIMQLAADIDAAEADAETLTEEIADLEAETAKLSADLKAATGVREKENTDYKAAHLDVSESIDAIARAIQVLKRREGDVPQSLAQVAKSNLLDEKTRTVITSFLALNTEDTVGAPEANAYEFQSGGVVDLLKKLKLKFEDQKLVLEKEEMASKANYQVLKQQLTDDIKANNASVEKKSAMKSKRLADAADAKGDKKVAETSLAEDETTLSDTLAECKVTSEDFENNQVTRAGEIKAINKAIEILSSDAVAGSAEEHLPKLLQKKVTPVLAQLRSALRDPQVANKVADFLQARAKAVGSRYLALIAVRAREDPFGKVKKMIKDLIVKLMEEANSEADQHAYCETELATNKQTREIKTSEVEDLTANLEEQEALFEKLTTEIADLSDAIAEIKAAQSKATSIRSEEKATNKATVEDATAAQNAVEKAIKVLKDFYSSAADLAFVQGKGALGAGLKAEMKQAALPTYKGNQDSSTGIFGMLEVVLSDFARLESETSAAEDAQQSAYDKMMDETNEDVAIKETEMNHKVDKKDRCASDITSLKKDLKLTQEELDKALDYYAKLNAQCVDTGLSYAERKKAREEEIYSLQEALKMLAPEDVA